MLPLQQASDYVALHESKTLTTDDREDHSFCGILFPISVLDLLPIESLVLNFLSIRGELGPVKVYMSSSFKTIFSNQGSPTPPPEVPDPYEKLSFDPASWKVIFNQHLEPSRTKLKQLVFSPPPTLLPGTTTFLYIHSTAPNDRSIVYDNQHSRYSLYGDGLFIIHPALAHVSNVPFGRMSPNGWGSAWRSSRSFVGGINVGVLYSLYSPSQEVRDKNYYALLPGSHHPLKEEARVAFEKLESKRLEKEGPRPARYKTALDDKWLHLTKFNRVVETLLVEARRGDSLLRLLPDDVLFYILNMCRWDWFGDYHDGVLNASIAGNEETCLALRRREEDLQARRGAAQARKEAAQAAGGGEAEQVEGGGGASRTTAIAQRSSEPEQPAGRGEAVGGTRRDGAGAGAVANSSGTTTRVGGQQDLVALRKYLTLAIMFDVEMRDARVREGVAVIPDKESIWSKLGSTLRRADSWRRNSRSENKEETEDAGTSSSGGGTRSAANSNNENHNNAVKRRSSFTCRVS